MKVFPIVPWAWCILRNTLKYSDLRQNTVEPPRSLFGGSHYRQHYGKAFEIRGRYREMAACELAAVLSADRRGSTRGYNFRGLMTIWMTWQLPFINLVIVYLQISNFLSCSKFSCSKSNALICCWPLFSKRGTCSFTTRLPRVEWRKSSTLCQKNWNLGNRILNTARTRISCEFS